MRPGLLEISIIIVVIIGAAVAARIFRTGRASSAQERESSPDPTEITSVKKPAGPRRFITRTGIAFILAGFVLLLAGISMFRWAFQSYIWAFIIIALGGIILFLSRKK